MKRRAQRHKLDALGLRLGVKLVTLGPSFHVITSQQVFIQYIRKKIQNEWILKSVDYDALLSSTIAVQCSPIPSYVLMHIYPRYGQIFYSLNALSFLFVSLTPPLSRCEIFCIPQELRGARSLAGRFSKNNALVVPHEHLIIPCSSASTPHNYLRLVDKVFVTR